MLVVELAFTPTSTPERLAARPAHREALARLHAEGKLFAAGPWADDRGALLVFAVERAGLEEILGADPYYRSTPGVEVRAIREWVPIVGG
ncbi:YciI family protein [Streptomyces sp. NPDC006335]|uniref:YciI family protein n=1 Tax=Streptomyces sp. NPDC006335 TaxID=3156895 RepID=UPI0033BC958D